MRQLSRDGRVAQSELSGAVAPSLPCVPPGEGSASAIPRIRYRALLLAVISAALLLRLLALVPFSMHHPDEIFQYLEPAHRMVFGKGIVTWEFRYGMRGWLLPTLLSWPMALGASVAPGGDLYLLLPRITVSILSLSIPIAAFAIGNRLSRTHAFVAMVVMSIWFEAIYFSAHVLSEEISVALVLPAAALMMMDGTRVARNYAAAGLLLGLAVAIRFQNGPALCVLGGMLCGRDIRHRWLPLATGVAGGLALSAMADLAQGAVPFSWIVANFEQNILRDRAVTYGIKTPLFYVGAIASYWLWLFPLLLLAVRPAIRSHRALFMAALINIALLSMISHKEYRFILLSTTILVLLAALGSVDLVRAWLERTGRRSERGAMMILLVLWGVGSASLAASPVMLARWVERSPELTLASDASRLPALCGLALDKQKFWQAGGYTYLHRGVPTYVTDPATGDHITPIGLDRASAAFNAIITPAEAISSIPKSFQLVSCTGTGTSRMCLLHRPGGCSPAVASHWDVQAVVLRHDL